MASFRGILQTFSPLTSSHRELRRNVFSVPKLGRVVGGSRPGCMGLCLTDPSQRRPEDCCCFCSTQRAQPPVPCSSHRGSFHTYAQGGLQGVTLCSHAVPPTPLGVPACARPLGMHRGLCYGQL